MVSELCLLYVKSKIQKQNNGYVGEKLVLGFGLHDAHTVLHRNVQDILKLYKNAFTAHSFPHVRHVGQTRD